MHRITFLDHKLDHSSVDAKLPALHDSRLPDDHIIVTLLPHLRPQRLPW